MGCRGLNGLRSAAGPAAYRFTDDVGFTDADVDDATVSFLGFPQQFSLRNCG
jgi:hypothetical protein